MSSKVSVITVAFNSAKTIADTLDSVSSQTYFNIEHIVIDGASTDATLMIVNAHGNPNLRLVSEPDKGIYDAMNKGLLLAKGDIVGFLNSDDIYSDNKVISKIVEAFQDPKVNACYGDLVYVTQDDRKVIRYWKSKNFVKGEFANGFSPPHPTFYIRKELLSGNGLFDLAYKLAADIEFMMRYMEMQGFHTAYLPKVLVRMRLGGATNQSWGNVIRQNKEIFSSLKKNRIPFSRVKFICSKISNRIQQYVVGYIKRRQ